MKNVAFITLLLLSMHGFSKNYEFAYTGRNNPSTTKQALLKAEHISDLVPLFWSKLILPFKEREELEYQRKMDDLQGCYIYYPQGYNYNRLIECVSLEITSVINGQQKSASNINDILSEEQKIVLNAVDNGSDVFINIKFRYKNKQSYTDENSDKMKEGGIVVTIVPETEAEYLGGLKELNKYIVKNIVGMISEKEASNTLPNVSIKFTINEEGKMVNVILSQTSSDTKIDQLIVTAFNKMPSWRPALNANGTKVKQTFTIPFGVRC